MLININTAHITSAIFTCAISLITNLQRHQVPGT